MATDTRTVYRRWCENIGPEDDTACWIWTGKRVHNGYGTFSYRVAGKRVYHYAHRYGYEALVGPIPPGLDLDHLCRRRDCVNPDHLEPVTRRENLSRSPLVRAHWAGLHKLRAARREAA